MEFVHVVSRIIQQISADILVPQCQGEPTIPPVFAGAVQAAIVVTVRLPIEEVNAVIVALEAACVAVDHVERHGDTMDVADIDKGSSVGLAPIADA